MSRSKDIRVESSTLSVDAAYLSILDEACGGNCLFIGTARNHNRGAEVTHLDFETYRSMALKEMGSIADEAMDRFDIRHMAIHHREGNVGLRDIAVIIAVSAVHRDAAFQACRFGIDELKKRVPIWKKEHLLDGSHWVDDRP